MSDSVETGKKLLDNLTPEQVEELLRQCELLRQDVGKLEARAVKCLKPKLRAVK